MVVVVITLSMLEERCEFFGGKPDLRTGPADKMRICVYMGMCGVGLWERVRHITLRA